MYAGGAAEGAAGGAAGGAAQGAAQGAAGGAAEGAAGGAEDAGAEADTEPDEVEGAPVEGEARYRGIVTWHNPKAAGCIPKLDINDKDRLLKRHADNRYHFLTTLPGKGKKAACEVCKSFGLGTGPVNIRNVTTGCPGCGRAMHQECFEAWHTKQTVQGIKHHMWAPPARHAAAGQEGGG